jgi:hypothetical protein
MGFVTQFFIRPYKAALVQPPAGSFTVDGAGRVVSCTLPASFHADHVKTIGQNVLNAFRRAKDAKITLTELTVQYAAFKLRAQQLPHGALVYLIPQKSVTDTDFAPTNALVAS